MSCEHTQRCSGHCCKRFYLPLSPEQLQHEYDVSTGATPDAVTRWNVQDLQKVHDMVIFLDSDTAKQDLIVDGVRKREADEPPAHYYTCKHHDAATGNCMNYEDRPNMCRDYPSYGSNDRCQYKDCTWEDGRNPIVPADRLKMCSVVTGARLSTKAAA